MAIPIHHQKGSLTTLSGTISVNVTAGFNVLEHIFVKSTTSTTTFDVTLTDIYDNVVLTREDSTGELNEELKLPAYGNFTFTILNANADEAFDYVLTFRE